MAFPSPRLLLGIVLLRNCRSSSSGRERRNNVGRWWGEGAPADGRNGKTRSREEEMAFSWAALVFGTVQQLRAKSKQELHSRPSLAALNESPARTMTIAGCTINYFPEWSCCRDFNYLIRDPGDSFCPTRISLLCPPTPAASSVRSSTAKGVPSLDRQPHVLCAMLVRR